MDTTTIMQVMVVATNKTTAASTKIPGMGEGRRLQEGGEVVIDHHQLVVAHHRHEEEAVWDLLPVERCAAAHRLQEAVVHQVRTVAIMIRPVSHSASEVYQQC
jgi:hypothetical protein